MWRVLPLLVVASASAQAAEFFCDPVPLCAWVPRDEQGRPRYNHTDPDAPWVIGGSEVVRLPEGDHGVGLHDGLPVVFVVEDATLEIAGLGDESAGFGAWLVLCDRATFRVRDAT